MKTTRRKCDIVISLATGFSFAFFFCYALALNPFTLYSGYDQAIFGQMGLGMLQGRIPYVDLFDHKGFLLYAINAAGLWLWPGHTGLGCLLGLCLSATTFYWLRISDCIVSPHLRYVPVLTALLFACLCEGGNMTETWSLCAISIPLYYLVKHVCGEQAISLRRWFITGICIGMAAHLRLNNIVPALAACTYLFVDLCRKKAFSTLAYSCIALFCGFCLVALVLMGLYVFLYGAHHMRDYWFGNVGFNLLYIDRFAHESLWQAAGLYFPLTAVTAMFCFRRNLSNKLVWFTAAAFLLTLLTTGTAYFAHYFTLSAPLVVLAISLSLGKSLCLSRRTLHFLWSGLALLLLVLSGVFHGDILRAARSFAARERAIAECRDVLDRLSTEQKRSVWNYNTMMAGANILQCAGIVQCNRIFLPFQADEHYGVAEVGKLEEICPDVILLDENTLWEEGHAAGALESRGKPKDRAFIRENYRLLHRSRTLIQEKRVCIYVHHGLENSCISSHNMPSECLSRQMSSAKTD